MFRQGQRQFERSYLLPPIFSCSVRCMLDFSNRWDNEVRYNLGLLDKFFVIIT